MNQPTKPTNLTCEFLTNPFIDVSHPRLSWQIESDASDVFQTAYQIIFSENEADILAGNGKLWDSGKVETAQSHLINYSGPELHSAQKVYWAVKIWDNKNNESDFSNPAFLETALMNENDWDNAKWIGRLTDINDRENEKAPLFRKEFSLGKKIVSARAYVSGLGFYEFYLNGKKVGNRLLDPGVTRYDKRVLYAVYDIKEYLSEKNAAGIILGNGFYNQFVDNAWDAAKAPWRNCPAFILKISVKFSDGIEKIITSDTSWKTSTGPIIFNGMYMGEVYDARLEKIGWTSYDYDDSEWQSAVPAIVPKGKLRVHSFPPIKITETFPAKKITEPKPGVFVADLGVNFAGWIKVKINADKGTKIIFKYGERVDQKGLIDKKSIGNLINAPDKFQTDVYIAKGEKNETFEPRFNYHGFQYVQIEGLTSAPKPEDITGCFLHTAFEQTGKFECSNELFNKIQDCTLRSYRSNFHHYPTDCPQREKNGWTADAHLAAEAGFRNFNPAAGYAKWLNDIKDEQRADGALPGIVPTAGWGYDWGNGPAWDSAHILICWYQYLYCGDKKILEEQFDVMKKYLNYVKEKEKKYEVDDLQISGGIINFGLGDWLPPAGFPDDGATPAALLLSAYYYKITELAAKIASIIGKNDDAEKLKKHADFIKENINKIFHIPSLGIYANGSMASQAAALYLDIVPNENIDFSVKQLVADVERMDYHPICGAHTAKFILHVLSDNGKTDIAYKIANQTTFPSWGEWIKKGATTLFECWQGVASLNHIFFGDISNWFYKVLAGIRVDIDNPGYKHFFVKPEPAENLTWVSAEQQTPYGKIKVAWKIKNNNFSLDVFVPHNSSATVIMPNGKKEKITSGNHKLECKL